jgi:glycerol-3-phosphate dehydrogenase
MNRQEIFSHYRKNPDLTVLIIGAGVNGIGTFRDLALQGVDVLMVDRGDFCSGASSASSHMVHGGVRYLENGEFRLVREAVKERNLLLINAPHLVKPLPTAFPVFKWFSGLFNAPFKFLGLLDKPAERGFLVIKIGMLIYDRFTRAHQTMPTHWVTWRKKARQKYPEMDPRILAVVTYYDAAMPSPERICIELVLDTEAESAGAAALNYVSAVKAAGEMVTLHDEITGETIDVRPRVVINAAGPWIDFVNGALGRQTKYIGGTKGSHIVLDHPRLKETIGNHEIFFENKDGRIVIIYPLEDKIQVGTTDIHIENPDDARCNEEEIDYFFDLVRRIFPQIEVDRSQIVFRFSGVRPLPSSEASTTGQISRDHITQVIEPGSLKFPIYNLVGGKWTTYRAFAEDVTNRVLGYLSLNRKASTELLPIGGGRDYPREAEAQQQWIAALGQKTGLPAERAAVLFDRYGTRAEEFAAFIGAGDDAPLSSLPGYSQREIACIVRREHVIHLDDIVLRRSLIAWLGLLTSEALDELALIAAAELGWTPEQRAVELTQTKEILADHHGLVL